ncbi:MAG: alpha/beta hydrolase [Chthoniobacterales bacterium]
MKHLLLAAVLCASGCVSKPDLPADIRRETRRVQVGAENISVDFYYRADSKPRPMAVIVHGFLANKERMAHWGVILAREGFLAAVPTNPTRANDNRNTAASVGLVQAGRAGLWPIAARNDRRVVLVGFSRGGFETILAAAELGDAIDAWVGLDPVDRNGKGKTAATNVRAPGLALLADPAPLNANGNAHGMLKHYAGPLEVVHVPETGHLDAESPQRQEKFVLFEGRVLGFLRRVFEL